MLVKAKLRFNHNISFPQYKDVNQTNVYYQAEFWKKAAGGNTRCVAASARIGNLIACV
jgi:hypothetical protein